MMRKFRPATPAEMRERLNVARECLLAGATRDAALRTIRERFGLSPNRAIAIWTRVVEDWERQNEVEKRYARVQAAQRLRNDLVKLRAGVAVRGAGGKLVYDVLRDEQGKPVREDGRLVRVPAKVIDYQAIAKLEALLAKVEGTNAPIVVKVDADVTVRQAVLHVIEQLTPEEQDRIIEEQQELERRAVLALPAASSRSSGG
jgi:hypothetical protein